MKYAATSPSAPRPTRRRGARSLPIRLAIFAAASLAILWACEPSRPIAAEVKSTVTLAADGQTRQIATTARLVAEVLAENGVALGELDRVTPSLDEPLSDGLKITVVRVAHEIEKREVPIPPETITSFDRRVARPIVLDPGKPGLKRQTFSIFTKDGVETERTLLESVVVGAPVPKRVVVGRRASLPARGASVMTMHATAYDPGPLSCGRYASGRTAVGMKAGKGVVAVDPRVIPLGTHLYIEGYGPAVAGDVGRAIQGRRIDLGFDTRKEALHFGRRSVKVYVVD